MTGNEVPKQDASARLLLSEAGAIVSGDARAALMAQALVWLKRLSGSSLALFYPVDQRLRRYGAGLTVAHGRTLSMPALEGALSAYDARGHLRDPFSPRHPAVARKTVIQLSDLDNTAAARYRAGFLARLQMCSQTTLLLRARGQVVAGVDLLSAEHDPSPTRDLRTLLHSSHPLLEQAYACALEAGPSAQATQLPSGRLTRREFAVARLVADGARNGEVAAALQVSEATIKTHLVRIYEKLEIGNRTQLAIMLNGAQRRPAAASRLGSALDDALSDAA